MTELKVNYWESPWLTERERIKINEWMYDRSLTKTVSEVGDFNIYAGKLYLETLVILLNSNVIDEIPMCVLSVNNNIVEQETKLSFERKLQNMFPDFYDKSKDKMKEIQFIKIERDD